MKFVLATGGTGGHLFPALKVAAALKQKGHEVIVAGALSMVEAKLKEQGWAYQNFRGKGFNIRRPRQCLEAFYLMVKAYFQSRGMLKVHQPRAVLGFGGYGSVPVVLAALSRNIPTMIHEQNVVPGRANKLLGKWVRTIAVSFPETRPYFKAEKTIHTGCPCHAPRAESVDRKKIRSSFGLDPDTKTILCFGGSQGSARLNQMFFDVMKSVGERIPILQIIHITGKNDYEEYKRRYKEMRMGSVLFPFLDRIDDAYRIADVAVSRAGAVSIHELMAFEVPSVIIPYPHAGGHQKFNARALGRLRLGLVIEEEDLTFKKLYDGILDRLLVQRSHFNQMDKTDNFFRADADGQLADALINLG